MGQASGTASREGARVRPGFVMSMVRAGQARQNRRPAYFGVSQPAPLRRSPNILVVGARPLRIEPRQ